MSAFALLIWDKHLAVQDDLPLVQQRRNKVSPTEQARGKRNAPAGGERWLARVLAFTPTLPSYGRCGGFAREKFVKLDGIPKDHCFVERLGALIPRRHPASFIQGDRRHGVQIVGERRSGLFNRR